MQYLDYGYIAIVLLLISLGLVMLYSTSYYSAQTKFGDDMYYFKRQAVFSLISLVPMLGAAVIDYRIYIKWSRWILGISWILMLLVLSPLGLEAYGARRWLRLPFGMSFQPSEIAKIAIILIVPYLITKMGNGINKWQGWLRIIVVAGITFLICYRGTDNLSTALIIFGIAYFLIIIANKKSLKFVLLAGGLAIGGIILAYYLATVMDSSGSFRIQRLLVWVNPEKYSDSGGYQIIQGLYAIGSGGFLGKGLGNSSQKLGYIPESQNDMILSVICEELGIFGVTLLLLMFALLLYKLLQIAKDAVDLQGSLIAMGIFGHISLQVVLNICVVLNLIPTTGVTLPFISYGGTAVAFLLAEMGIALSVEVQSRKAREAELAQLNAELDRQGE